MTGSFVVSQLAYQVPPELPKEALDELIQIRNVSEDKQGRYFNGFNQKYYKALNDRRKVQLENMSNFATLVELFLERNDQTALSELQNYKSNIGFYVWQENNKYRFKYKIAEALQLVNEYMMSEAL